MFFYIDESGQTGLNLFDKNQPFLYYGVLSSKLNLDILALKTIVKLRKKLNVERLHAAELGNGKLVEIMAELEALRKKFDLKFDFYRVAKADHAIISFFDQTFDQGVNPSVPWTAYWTPLKYILLLKVAHLFDEEMAKEAWKARITIKDSTAHKHLINVCNRVLEKVNTLPDKRSIDIITDAMNWVIKNPSQILYNASSKDEKLQISPNLIGFQIVMHGIANRLEKSNAKSRRIIVDRQSEFNNAQKWIAKFYQDAKGLKEPMKLGIGLPEMDLRHMPSSPIECTPGTESCGLELVDLYIWIFKRNIEGKKLAPPLFKVIEKQLRKGRYDEVSLNAIGSRWGKWFEELPEPSEEDLKKGQEIRDLDEERRKEHVAKELES